MPILTLSNSPHTDRSFRIGVGLLVVFAVAEVSSAGYYYLRRFQASRPASESVAVSRPTATPKAPPPVTTRATPPPVAVASPAAAAMPRVDRLVQEGIAFRDRGDNTNALARFFEASEAEPKNAKVLEETARTYEKLELWDRSNETWRKIQDLGPTAGASYDLALTRLKTGAPKTTTTTTATASATPATTAPSPVPSATAAPTVVAALTKPSPAASAPPPGSDATPTTPMFTIAQIKASEEPDPDADTNLTLRIAVKKQTNQVIDHTKVKIQVFFYDTVDDKDIKLTNAEVNYEWVTSKHDWAGPDPEVLSVNYLRPKNKAMTSEAALAAAAASVNPGRKGKPANASPPAEGGKRTYLGYIVRVYYHDELQAQKAEPRRLLKLFPASTASP